MSGLDFSRLNRRPASETATEPRRIFAALPSKDSKYAYPRDVQADVWEKWHERRNESDLVIKMNTGGGKTVVGLIILKSCLNEEGGPAVYLCPDNYLADQVRAEATGLGIDTTADPRSNAFQTGKAILVTNIYRLVNGQSVFGVKGDTRLRIEIGALLVDDAHACLATVEEQFTLRVPLAHAAYDGLLNLFEDYLRHQSQPTWRDLREGDRTTIMEVPYWAWGNRQAEVLDVLHPRRDDDDFKFNWPLIRECLHLCRAVIGADNIEIRPPCIPRDRIPSFSNARRRLYLSATLADDSVFVTHFGANTDSVGQPITPATADDLGDRMILMPLETHPGTTEADVRDFLAEQATRHNVVIIAPSWRRAEVWEPIAAAVYDRDTIEDGVNELRAGHVGLVVLVNKYDGIDLPGEACRILALDGLPEAYGASERIEAAALDDTEVMAARQFQRIEQGMGRAVRSNDDYCVVFLLGPRLTQRLNASYAAQNLSPATRAQIGLSRQVAEMLENRPSADLASVVDQCLTRDKQWVEASRSVLDGITYDTGGVSESATLEREAFDKAELGRYREAHDLLQRAAGNTTNTRVRGWVKQQAAAYLNHVDQAQAQVLQTAAQSDNRRLLKPLAGVTYQRLAQVADQAAASTRYLGETYASGPKLVVGVEAILSDLVPRANDLAAVEEFEEAFRLLGKHIGFESQRPETEIGNGPDVLWALGGLNFAVIECKSGVENSFISKHNAAQLSHSMNLV